MLPTRKGHPPIRPLVLAACLLLGLHPGCSHPPDRPLVELPPALNSREIAATPANPDEEVSPPVAGDGDAGAASVVRPTSFAGDCPHPLLPLSLPEAIRFGLENSPRLRSALAAIERAAGQEQAAFAPFLPQIDVLTRGVATSKTLLPGAPGIVGVINVTEVSPYSVLQSELQIQWTLYDFGRTAGRYHQAQMREKITQLQAERAKETVAYDVAVAYFQALEAQAIRKIAVQAIRRAEAVLEDTRARRAQGVALRDDVLRGEVQLSESRDALVRAEDAEVTALARLNNALGRDASLPLKLADGLSPAPFRATLAECLELASQQRPEVGAARDRVAAAQFGRQAAHGEFLPRLTLLAGLGRVDGQETVNGWQEGVGIHLNVPLYHGGGNVGRLREADADIHQALADAQGILNDVTLEVTVAHRGVVSAQTRVDLARPAVKQARETLRLVRQRYRQGTATPTDVVDAETARTRSEQRYATASIELLSALARLAYARGDQPGGIWAPLACPNVPPPSELPMPRRDEAGR
jgi:outer membrane protein TolC